MNHNEKEKKKKEIEKKVIEKSSEVIGLHATEVQRNGKRKEKKKKRKKTVHY